MIMRFFLPNCRNYSRWFWTEVIFYHFNLCTLVIVPRWGINLSHYVATSVFVWCFTICEPYLKHLFLVLVILYVLPLSGQLVAVWLFCQWYDCLFGITIYITNFMVPGWYFRRLDCWDIFCLCVSMSVYTYISHVSVRVCVRVCVCIIANNRVVSYTWYDQRLCICSQLFSHVYDGALQMIWSSVL